MEEDNFEAQTSETENIRDILLELADRGEIKYTPQYIKKSSDKNLESIYQKYKRDQVRETCETLTNTIIAFTTDLAEKENIISRASSTGKKLEKKKLLRQDLNSVVSYVVPFLPYIGLIKGALTFGKDAYDHLKNRPEKEPKATSERRASV